MPSSQRASSLVDATRDKFRTHHIVAVRVHTNRGDEPRVVDRDDFVSPFRCRRSRPSALKKASSVWTTHGATRFASLLLSTYGLWVTPHELPLGATARAETFRTTRPSPLRGSLGFRSPSCARPISPVRTRSTARRIAGRNPRSAHEQHAAASFASSGLISRTISRSSTLRRQFDIATG